MSTHTRCLSLHWFSLALLLALGAFPTSLAQRSIPQKPLPKSPHYSVTDLGTLGGKWTTVKAMNAKGQIVGICDFPSDAKWAHGYLWQSGKMKTLGRFQPSCINNRGQTLGIFSDLSDGLYSQGQVRYLNFTPTSGIFNGKAINDRGQVVGTSITQRGVFAFFWQNGKVQYLNAHPTPLVSTFGSVTPAKVSNSEAKAINNLGQIVGIAGFPPPPGFDPDIPWADHVVLWQDGKMLDLGVPKGFQETNTPAINNKGQVLFQAEADNFKPSYHCAEFLWENGKITPLGTSSGFRYTEAYALNDAGQIVGDIENAKYLKHAFLWQNGRIVDLNSLIPAKEGWILKKAVCVNNRGQIAGEGTHHGRDRAFLLTPLD